MIILYMYLYSERCWCFCATRRSSGGLNKMVTNQVTGKRGCQQWLPTKFSLKSKHLTLFQMWPCFLSNYLQFRGTLITCRRLRHREVYKRVFPHWLYRVFSYKKGNLKPVGRQCTGGLTNWVAITAEHWHTDIPYSYIVRGGKSVHNKRWAYDHTRLQVAKKQDKYYTKSEEVDHLL